MKELKCPKCGNIFTVDEADYAQLLNQVKNSEFEAELARRVHELEQSQKVRQDAERQAAQAKAEADRLRLQADQQQKLHELQAKIDALNAQVQQADQQKELAVAQVRQKATESYMAKEQELASLRSQTNAEIKALQDQVAYYKDLKIKRELTVKLEGKPMRYLNELEWIDGRIWANVYTTDLIVVINPSSGVVEAKIDCSGLLPKSLDGGWRVLPRLPVGKD